MDPAEDSEGPVLPSASSRSSEFRPFSRLVPEFKFWYLLNIHIYMSYSNMFRYTSTRAMCIGYIMTFFKVCNVPVFWPLLLMYFVVLFGMTMKRQYSHMVKHNYVPWSSAKKVYGRSNVN